MAPATGVVTRTVVLGGKVKRRAYHHAMARVGTGKAPNLEKMVADLLSAADKVCTLI